MVWLHQRAKLLSPLLIWLMLVTPAFAQLHKLPSNSKFYVQYTGTTSGTWRPATNGTIGFETNGGVWTFTVSKEATLTVRGVAAGGAGASCDLGSAPNGAGGGGGARDMTGETFTVFPGVTYQVTVGVPGQPTTVKILSSTVYMSLNAGTAGSCVAAGTGGSIVTGANAIAGNDGTSGSDGGSPAGGLPAAGNGGSSGGYGNDACDGGGPGGNGGAGNAETIQNCYGNDGATGFKYQPTGASTGFGWGGGGLGGGYSGGSLKPVTSGNTSPGTGVATLQLISIP